MKCIDFANQYLFAPLGIPEHKIHGASDKDDQFDFLMNKAPKKNEWYSDPKDTVTAGWGLCLSAMDMAKIGFLRRCLFCYSSTLAGLEFLHKRRYKL